MVFATVCDQVPLLGFEKQPKYEFSARNTLPTDSMCGPTLHLPLNIGLKQFTEKMTFAITYSFALGLARCKANIIYRGYAMTSHSMNSLSYCRQVAILSGKKAGAGQDWQ